MVVSRGVNILTSLGGSISSILGCLITVGSRAMPPGEWTVHGIVTILLANATLSGLVRSQKVCPSWSQLNHTTLGQARATWSGE